jgi:DNA-binding CsgD family transcriptional regulator
MASLAGRTPFVGHQHELETLKEQLTLAGQGQGRVVLVAGEPGIGKTRLLTEIARHARAEGWLVLGGRAYDSEGMPPYLPFTEALQGYVRRCSLEGLQAVLGSAGPDVALLVPALRERLPDLPAAAPVAPDVQRYRLFEAVSDFLVAVAGSEFRIPSSASDPLRTRNSELGTGVLLLIDDLHWADAPSLLLVRHLARRLAEAPLVLLGAYRTTDLGRTHPLSAILADLRRERLVERLALAPLSEAETTAQISALVGQPPAAAVAAAVQQVTQGNPFFTEEVVSALQAEGRVLTDPAAAVGAWSVPEGVRQVIGVRLGRLSMETTQVLQASAVLGEGFCVAVLAATSGLAIEALTGAVEESTAAGMLREEADGYQFGHPLIRQTLAEELSLPRRQRLHLRAAEAIESVHAHNLAPHLAALAGHYRLAGAAADEEQAISYAIRAGEQAQAVYAWEEAVRQWQAAVELLEETGAEPERRADLLVRLGDLIFASEWGAQRGPEYLEAALALYAGFGQVRQAAEVQVRLGRYFSTDAGSEDLPRALSHFHAARPVLERAASAEVDAEIAALGHLSIGLGFLAVRALELEPDALERLERALAIGERLGDVDLQGQALAILAAWPAFAGRVGEANAMLSRAWELAAGRCTLVTSALIALHAEMVCAWVRDPRAGMNWLERWLGQPATAGATRQRAHVLMRTVREHWQLGALKAARRAAQAAGGGGVGAFALAHAQGDSSQARAVAEQRRAICHHRGDRFNESGAIADTALILRLEGGVAAEAGWRAALALWAPLGPEYSRLFELHDRPPLALLLAETGRPDEARAEVERCRAIVANGEDWRALLGTVERAEAATLAAEGNLAEAESHFERALAIFQQFGLVWEEAETQLVSGRFLRDAIRRERERAADHFDAAISIYRRIGAGEPWINRVQEERMRLQARFPLSPQSSLLRRAQASVLSPRYPDGLSPREVEVLRLIAAGTSNAEIADELAISLNTVARHINHIFTKTGAANRAQAVIYAHRHGLAE